MDRPLVAYKVTGGNAGAEVIPHMNWRGLFSRGTNASGGTSTVAVEWPGFRTTAHHSMGSTQATTKNWMGSLLEGQRDAGGQMYMRNRYYDPATGQFTQTDPIGIVGGLNTYGFAGGDPVSYSDPYGLFKCPGDPGCPPAAPAARPSGTITYSGVVVNMAVLFGATAAAGSYTGSDGQSGTYIRFGFIPVGYDVSAGVEMGVSQAGAMEGAASTACGGLFLANGCSSKNEDGEVTGYSGGAAVGPSETAFSGHWEVTNTVLVPDKPKVIPRTMANDATAVRNIPMRREEQE